MMKIYRDYPFNLPAKERAIALGFFDGVHLGHKALIENLLKVTENTNLSPTVFTFAEHPDSAFQPELSFQGLLMDQRMRENKMAELGVEELIMAPLIPEIYQTSAQSFLTEYLLNSFQARALIVGRDFTFGHKAQGNIALMAEWCKLHDVRLIVVDDVNVLNSKVSSTRIRNLIRTGQIEEANQCLGEPYTLMGKVCHGQKLGRTLGFPTLNIKMDPMMVIPRFGVYASMCIYQGKMMPSITNIGIRPTVYPDDRSIKSESYVYFEKLDLYDQEISVQLLSFVRSEAHFASIKALQRQVQRDKKIVMEYHQKYKKQK